MDIGPQESGDEKEEVEVIASVIYCFLDSALTQNEGCDSQLEAWAVCVLIRSVCLPPAHPTQRVANCVIFTVEGSS